MTTLQYPLVNNVVFDWSSVELKFDGDTIVGFKAVNYSESLEGTQVYGAAAEAIGETRGVYKAEGSIELYKKEATALITKMGNGWGVKRVDIVVQFSEPGADITTVELLQVRIKKNDNSHSQGGDALTTKFDLSIIKPIKTNGLTMLDRLLEGQVIQ